MNGQSCDSPLVARKIILNAIKRTDNQNQEAKYQVNSYLECNLNYTFSYKILSRMKPASKYCHAAVVTAFRSEDCFWFPCGSCLLDRHWQGYAKIQLFSDCVITVLGFCSIGFWLSYSFLGTMLLVSGSYLVLCS